jgi:hypothetical protein
MVMSRVDFSSGCRVSSSEDPAGITALVLDPHLNITVVISPAMEVLNSVKTRRVMKKPKPSAMMMPKF